MPVFQRFGILNMVQREKQPFATFAVLRKVRSSLQGRACGVGGHRNRRAQAVRHRLLRQQVHLACSSQDCLLFTVGRLSVIVFRDKTGQELSSCYLWFVFGLHFLRGFYEKARLVKRLQSSLQSTFELRNLFSHGELVFSDPLTTYSVLLAPSSR